MKFNESGVRQNYMRGLYNKIKKIIYYLYSKDTIIEQFNKGYKMLINKSNYKGNIKYLRSVVTQVALFKLNRLYPLLKLTKYSYKIDATGSNCIYEGKQNIGEVLDLNKGGSTTIDLRNYIGNIIMFKEYTSSKDI